MSLNTLKEKVAEANKLLGKTNLVLHSWGNVSQIDRKKGIIAIKASGIECIYTNKDFDVALVDLDGNVQRGSPKPSSDTPTHIELYKAFPEIGGITHTHSKYAVMFAQAGKSIPCMGTTHADYFCGEIPITEDMAYNDIFENYEKNTGLYIAEKIKNYSFEPLEMPGILVKSHGPFTWGKDAEESVKMAEVLETVAEMAYGTLQLNSNYYFENDLLEKHYKRKHGKDAYYGQDSR